MPVWRVDFTHTASGRPGHIHVEAETESQARERAASPERDLGRVSPWQDPFSERAPLAGPGSYLASSALQLAIFGVVLPPLAVVGVVMGAAAQERSGGAHGGGAVRVGMVVVGLWALLTTVYVVVAVGLSGAA